MQAAADLDEVPFFPQKDYQCGPAALAAVLAFDGVAVGPDDLVSKVYLPDRRGSLQIEMIAAPRRYGLVSMPLSPRLDDVLREVQAGNPVIVLQDYGAWPVHTWHYAVVIGFDRAKGRVTLRSGEKRRLEMPLQVLEYTWKKSDYWAMVVMPPERVPATVGEAAWLSAVAAMERVGPSDSARSAYASSLRRWPASLNGSIGLSNALYSAGRLGQAESVLQAARARYPGSVVVLNNLAQVMSDQRHYDEALRVIDEAIAQGGEFLAAAQATREQIRERIRNQALQRPPDQH